MSGTTEQSGAAKPKNMGMLLQIVFAVINLSVMGGGAYLVYASTMGWENPKITEEDASRELASVSSGEAELAAPSLN
jgi:flagellar FliL protein